MGKDEKTRIMDKVLEKMSTLNVKRKSGKKNLPLFVNYN